MSEIQKYLLRREGYAPRTCVLFDDHAAAIAEKDAEISHLKNVLDLILTDMAAEGYWVDVSKEEILKHYDAKAREG